MKMWEIRESNEYPSHFGYKRGSRGSMGMRSSDDELYYEGYECGYEEGYRKAMKEAKRYYSEDESSYGERRMMK